MAWASEDIVIATLQIPVSYSIATSGTNPFFAKIAPLNSSGAKFDFTAATALSLTVETTASLPGVLNVVGGPTVPTLVSHDATGLGFSLTAAQMLSTFLNLGTASPIVTLTATDGTTVLQVAKGSAQITVGP